MESGRSTQHRWRFLPHLMVRVAGFPVDLLEPLRATQTVDALARLDAIEDDLARHREWVVVPRLRVAVPAAREADDRGALRSLSQARRAITGDRVVGRAVLDALPPPVRAACEQWNGLLSSRDLIVGETRMRFATERERCRGALRSLVARADILDALLLSSPSMRVAAERYVASGPPAVPRTGAIRKLERRLAAYLQRFCAKNETQSFFGPVNYGRMDEDRPQSVTVVRGGEGMRRRESFPAQWMAELLGACIAADPRTVPGLCPRRGTRDRPAGSDWTDADLRLYARADGTATVADLADHLGEPWPETWSRVQRLASAGAVVTGPVIPPDLPDPLTWLMDWLSGVDSQVAEDWLPVLGSLRERVRSFAHAPTDERVKVLTGLSDEFTAACAAPAARSGGRMYADRALLFEECLGDLAEFTVGGHLYRTITERLVPVLRLATHYGVFERRRDGRAAAALLSSMGGPEPDLTRYFAVLATHGRDEPADGVRDELDDLMDGLARLVAERSDGRVARLRGEDLPDGGLPRNGSEPEECTFTSMDLMVRAGSLGELLAGRFQLVLGEIHPQPLLWVFPSAHFLDPASRGELGTALRDGLAAQPGGPVAAQFVHTRANKIFPYELPGHRVELRPRRPTVDSIPAADVLVRRRGEGVCCWSAGAGWLRFYPPLRRRHDRLDPVAPLAFPAVHLPVIGDGERIPRIEVDGVVVQRERWELVRGEFALTETDDFDLFRAAWRVRRALGLPMQVYVRVPAETKPVFVDFGNLFLVELLAQLGRSSPTMTVTEALPATDETWLEGPGGRFTVELRLVVLGVRP